MGRGILNLVIGGAFIVGGLTGKLALIGTDSGIALALIGFGLVGLGLWRIGSAKKAAPDRTPPDAPGA